MSESNPMVKATVDGTLDGIINSLQFISKALSFPIDSEKPKDEDEQTSLMISELSGLKELIDCTQAAAVTCYGQYFAQLHQAQEVDNNKSQKIDNLQASTS